MTAQKSRIKGIVFVLCTFLSACSSAPKQIESGFLVDYTQLQKSQKYENTSVYLKTGFNRNQLAQIKSIKLVPFEIWINGKDTSGINVEKLRELHLYFHKELRQHLESDYQIVSQADEDTLTIRGAFSGVKLVDPEISVVDFLPIRLVFNAGNSAYLNATDQKDIISEVSIEVEFLLGTSLQRVFAMTASKQLNTTIKQDGLDNIQAVERVLDIWIDNFVKSLAEIRNLEKN